MFNYYPFSPQFYSQGQQIPREGTESTIPSQEVINAQRDYQNLQEKYRKLKSKFT
jgi:hypothetical protein